MSGLREVRELGEVWSVRQRVGAVVRRLGATPDRFQAALEALLEVLRRHGAAATFPTTALPLARHPQPLQALAAQGMEVAVHSFQHLDLAGLPPAVQRDQVVRARQVFDRAGIKADGFRAPYLRWNEDLLRVLASTGFHYDSSSCVWWPVVPVDQRLQPVIDYYRPDDAAVVPVLPALRPEGLVALPVSLPDDEMLVDRLGLTTPDLAAIWRNILDLNYAADELFVLLLHPERGLLCAEALDQVLADARQRQPAVWIATLAAVAEWWKIRPQCQIDIVTADPGLWQVQVSAPAPARLLAQAAEVLPWNEAASAGLPVSRPWLGSTCEVLAHRFVLRSPRRPVIGLAPGSALPLLGFLRQQGYIVEVSAERSLYPVYFERREFDVAHEGRQVIRRVEDATAPLLRFGRWPAAARSALVVSGDIDALTVWDYLWRLREG